MKSLKYLGLMACGAAMLLTAPAFSQEPAPAPVPAPTPTPVPTERVLPSQSDAGQRRAAEARDGAGGGRSRDRVQEPRRRADTRQERTQRSSTRTRSY